eukprot:8156347-Lingulodinium_polyedra.AAC.1
MSRMWRTPNKPMFRPTWRGRPIGCVFLKTSAVARRPRWNGLCAVSLRRCMAARMRALSFLGEEVRLAFAEGG